MLAYTTVTSFIHLPSLVEAVVYLVGLGGVILLPSFLLNYLDNRAQKPQSFQDSQHHNS